MYKIDNKYQKAKIKNLEKRLDFQKYNIKEKKKNKKKKKTVTRIIKKQQQQPHTKNMYDIALKIGSLFFEKWL